MPLVIVSFITVATAGAHAAAGDAQDAQEQTVNVTISPTAAEVPLFGSVTLTVTLTPLATPADSTQPITVLIGSTFGVFGLGVPVPITPDVTNCRLTQSPHTVACDWTPVAVGETARLSVTWSFTDSAPVGDEGTVCANADSASACSTITAIASALPVMPVPVTTDPQFTG